MKRIFSDAVIISTLLILLGLVYFHSFLIVWALLITWLLFNCASLIVHEGWAHNYITPKNKFIGYIMDLFGYLTFLPNTKSKSISPKLFWMYQHILHHKHWKGDDVVQWGLDHNHWLIYTFTSKMKKSKRILNDEIIKNETNRYTNGMDSFSKLIDDYYTEVILLIHLTLLLAMGVEYYFYFVLFQAWIFGKIMIIVGEIIPHYKKTASEEKDALYLFPLVTGNAYHVLHHQYQNVLFLGKGWLKYINIQYYFIKLFYNIRPGVLLA